MRKILSLNLIIGLLFTSCSSTFFTQSQPQGYDEVSEIPDAFHGEFIDLVSLSAFSSELLLSLKDHPFDYHKREFLIDSAVSKIKDSVHLIINSSGFENNLKYFNYLDDSVLIIKFENNSLYLNTPGIDNTYGLCVIKLDSNDKYFINVDASSGWLDTNNINFLKDTSSNMIIEDISIDKLSLLINHSLSSQNNLLIEIDDLFTDSGTLRDLYFELIDNDRIIFDNPRDDSYIKDLNINKEYAKFLLGG